MKFGIDQFNKPTPKTIVRAQTAFNYLAFSIVAFTGFFCRNFAIDPIDLTEGVGISCIVVNFIAIFFGVKPIEPDNQNKE